MLAGSGFRTATTDGRCDRRIGDAPLYDCCLGRFKKGDRVFYFAGVMYSICSECAERENRTGAQ